MGYYYTLEGRRYREGTDHHYLIVELSPIVPSKVATAHRKLPSVGANKTRVGIAAFTCPGFCPGFCPYLPEGSYSVIVIIATHRYCHVENERR